MVHSKLVAVELGVVDVATRLLLPVTAAARIPTCGHLLFYSPILPSCLATIAPAPGLYVLFQAGGWQVQFTEADLKTPLPRKLTFTDPEKSGSWPARGSMARLKSRQMLEHAIETGRVGST